MKVILRTGYCGPKGVFAAGEAVDLDPEEAARWIAQGLAERTVRRGKPGIHRAPDQQAQRAVTLSLETGHDPS